MGLFCSCPELSYDDLSQEIQSLQDDVKALKKEVLDLGSEVRKQSDVITALTNSSIFKIAISVEKAIYDLAQQKATNPQHIYGLWRMPKPSVMSYGSGL